jgi:hypothetical protein
MEEDFYATLKFKNGEEVFAKISASEEAEKTMLVVFSPIVITEFKSKTGITGYKMEPWLKTTTDDMFIVNIDDVLTISESSDIEMIMLHQSFVRQRPSNKNSNKCPMDRKMGYIANVNDAKEILEKIFKNS